MASTSSNNDFHVVAEFTLQIIRKTPQYLSSKLDHYYTVSKFRDPYSVSKSVSLLIIVIAFRKRITKSYRFSTSVTTNYMLL